MKTLAIDARMFSSSFTGVGRYVAEIIGELQKTPLDFSVVLFLNEKEFSDFTVQNPNIKKVLAPEKIYSLEEQTSFLKKINAEKPDFFWSPFFNVPFFLKTPFATTVHDLTLSKYPGKNTSFLKKLAYKLIMHNALHRSQLIFAVSENTKKDIVQEGILPFKVDVILNGISKEFLEFAPNPNFSLENFGITKPYFFYSGNWKEHKNIARMVESFAEFVKKNGEVAQLVLSGAPDLDIWEIVKQKNLRHLVRAVGMVGESDLLHLYYNAKIFVFPSLYEGFGLPLLEAMAMNIPVISSKTPALREVGEDAAVYFNPLSVEEMTKAMKIVFFDENVQEELREKGKIQVQKFSWKKSAEKHISALSALMERK